jgi:pantetheine-phosphate adenylyltransferase
MPKAIYPGSFDPVHNGHVDIARRAAAVFDEVIVAIYQQPPSKTLLFTTEERVQLFEEATVEMPNIRVTPFSGLAPDFARSVGADFILRGLRAGFDFELEFEMALMWRSIAPDIDVVCMMSSLEHQFVYSSRIKEVAQLGADVSRLIPENVARAMREKLSS